MKKKLTFLCAVIALFVTAILFICNTASAQNITVSGEFKVRSNDSPSETGHMVGDTFWVGASAVPNGNNGTVAWVGSVVNPRTAQLPFRPQDVFPNLFENDFAYNSAKNGAWQLLFENGTNSTTVMTPSTIGAPLVPIASNVAISGSGTTPTFTWSYGSFTPDALIIRLWDLEKGVNAYQTTDIIYTQTLPNTQNSFTVPGSWTLPSGATQSLQQNHQYDIDIRALIARTDASGNKLTITDTPQVLSQSVSSFDFVPLPASAPANVYLPTTTPPNISNPEPVYTFHTTVVDGQTIFVDPLVAIGYDYQIGAGNPDFASVTLPTGIGDNLFDLYLYNGTNYYFKAQLTGGVTYDFASGGVDRFRILGIETSADLDPNNPTAFITGLSFEGSGQFTGTMTPISQDYVPEPATMLLLGLGLMGLAGVRRKFKN